MSSIFSELLSDDPTGQASLVQEIRVMFGTPLRALITNTAVSQEEPDVVAEVMTYFRDREVLIQLLRSINYHWINRTVGVSPGQLREALGEKGGADPGLVMVMTLVVRELLKINSSS